MKTPDKVPTTIRRRKKLTTSKPQVSGIYIYIQIFGSFVRNPRHKVGRQNNCFTDQLSIYWSVKRAYGFKNNIAQMLALTGDARMYPFLEVLFHSNHYISRNPGDYLMNNLLEFLKGSWSSSRSCTIKMYSTRFWPLSPLTSLPRETSGSCVSMPSGDRCWHRYYSPFTWLKCQ